MLPDRNEPAIQSMIARIKGIIMSPRAEWPVIARETTPSGEIFTRYVMPLAAIGPICGWLGRGFWGFSGALFSYLMSLAGVFVMTFAVEQLAPKFGGQASRAEAFRLVAYSGTAGWLAGVFSLVPALSILGLVGLYSIYLLYLGTGPMLKVPADKQLPFTVVLVICLIAFGILIGGLFGALMVGSLAAL